MYQTFQEPEDPGPGQVVKKENDREHKVFKVKLNLLIFMLFLLETYCLYLFSNFSFSNTGNELAIDHG